MRRKISAIIGVLLIGALVNQAAEERIERSFQVNSGGTLNVKTESGSIKIVPQNKEVVSVLIMFESRTGSQERLKKIIQDFDLQIEQDGNDVNIVLENKNDSFFSDWWKKINVEFEISVPRKYNARLRTSGGSISVGDLKGEVWSRTSGGSLKFGRITGALDGKTSGGSIHLEGCKGPVNVSTSGGNITMGGVEGDVEASTSGGSITVDEVKGSVKASTSGGSIRATITKQPENDCELKTSGGSITVTLSEEIKVHVDAKTSGGGVSTDFPVMVKGNISGHALNAQINGGGPLLILRTSGGGISIKKAQ